VRFERSAFSNCVLHNPPCRREEIAGQQPAGPRSRECPPRRIRAAPDRAGHRAAFDERSNRSRGTPGGPARHAPADIPTAGSPRQPRDHSTDPGAENRLSGPVRITPLPGQQATVPRQQGRRRDQSVSPDRGRQHPSQRGQDRSVRPREPGPVDLPARHRDLMPQREQLGGDRGIATDQRG
jgi:hypothetical protein